MIIKFNILSEGLDKYQVFGKRDVSVTGITDDSRKVKKGHVFVAIKGLTQDAHKYIPRVINSGAKVVVGEKEPKKEWLNKITYVRVQNSRRALGLLASTWHDNPSKKLKVIGITGTDGKTTTVSIAAHILNCAGKKTGLITTVSAKIGGKEYDTGFHVTNPEPLLLQEFLAKMVKNKCEYAVLEVTSHGLDQERVAGIDFEIGVLTNITNEHLDYHKTYKSYLKAKSKLFNNSKIAILNKEDKSFELIKRIINKNVNVITYDRNLLKGKLKQVVKKRFPEFYNQLNATAAVLIARKLNVSDKQIASAITSFPGIKGRMEEIKNNKGFEIYIDFAHTPNSLENVLTALRERTRGKLIVVFGSAGERDAEKRPEMAKISTKFADISIFTAEDPRSEDVNDIIKQMFKGVGKKDIKKVKIIPERAEAISYAINKVAKKGDMIVVCGKGHEKSMAYDGIEHPWSDKHIAENALNAKKDLCAVILAAGKGTRLKSKDPKVLSKIAGRSMISYTLANLRKALFGNLITVVGYKKQLVMESIGFSVSFACQNKMLGTGHATWQGMKMISKKMKNVVVLNGDDGAFYKPETISKILSTHKKKKAVITFVSLQKSNPFGLGRVARDSKGKLLGIIEEKDANSKQKKITEVNDGLYVFNKNWFLKNIIKVKKSSSGEYYLVDLVKVALDQGKKVKVYKLQNKNEWFGVNTKKELQIADREMRKLIREKHQS